MKFFILIFGILLLSCTNKSLLESEILFEIQNKELYKSNILELKIINKSNNNYFFCFDTTSIYYGMNLNHKINEFIHPRPIFYLKDDIIDIGYPLKNMIKPISKDTVHYNCVKKNIQYRQNFLKDLGKLKKTIRLKRNTSITIKLPFDNSHIWCNEYYTYLREKGNFEIQFKYKMDGDYFDKIIDKRLLLEYQHNNFKPYYGEIVSNKVSYILK